MWRPSRREAYRPNQGDVEVPGPTNWGGNVYSACWSTARHIQRFKRRDAAATVALLTLPAIAGTAVAAGDDYPDRSARDCSAQLGAYSWCLDKNGNEVFQRSEQFSSPGFSYRNCSDFVAWRMNSANGLNFCNSMGCRRRKRKHLGSQC